MMQVVSAWWNEELAESKCWHTVDVVGRGKLVVHFKNRPAGDYHAVCAFMQHQGARCNFPCIWCEVRDTAGKDRACNKCSRYSCAHTPFTGIHPSIVTPVTVDRREVGSEPAWFEDSIDASHELLKPRREGNVNASDRATRVQQATAQRAQKRKQPDGQSRSTAEQTSASTEATNALNPRVTLLCHPQVCSLQMSLLLHHLAQHLNCGVMPCEGIPMCLMPFINALLPIAIQTWNVAMHVRP